MSALASFDWSLRYAFAGSGAAHLRRPLVRLELHASSATGPSPVPASAHAAEFTAPELDAFIAALEHAAACLPVT